MKFHVLASLIGLSVIALFSGCEAVPSQSAPPQVQRTSAVIESSKDRVWPLIVSSVGLDYPVRAIEKDSGLLTTDWVTLPAGFNNMSAGRWVIPPGGFLATWNGLRMNMKVMAVESESGKTSVTINCHFEAFEDNVQKTWLVVQSNGAIENDILTRIENAVKSAPPVATVPKAIPAVAAPVQQKSASESILELKKLFDAGAITQEEFEVKKKALLEKI